MKKYILTIIGSLLFVYITLIYFSLQGYGYAGYYSSERMYYRPSIWIWSRPDYYPVSRNVRAGSLGNRGGGGIHGGK